MNPALKRALKIEAMMMVLGVVAALGLLFVLTYVPLEPWEKIDTLSNGPVVSLSEHYPSVYATLSDDVIYECPIHDKTCTLTDLTSAPAPRISDPSYSCGDPNTITQPVPGHVTASVSFRECGIDTVFDVYFVGLDDGSLWRWHEGTSPADMIIYPVLLILAFAFVGVVLGIPLNLILYFWRRRTQDKTKRSA